MITKRSAYNEADWATMHPNRDVDKREGSYKPSGEMTV